ncbi:hypothetical protein K435DRAFT_55925 [Dendrothele bispora CBS 962.96]|uniref:Uncharacterized protein n=1 Tax=Dendrothele bispora (strain CBS 962.96) TaxID=1314807 RepID=A0A4S8M778_DENBC|nr:hypothetical protein K435DRAFT_55925 [Dendrothele bispora CBS 962.96]
MTLSSLFAGGAFFFKPAVRSLYYWITYLRTSFSLFFSLLFFLSFYRVVRGCLLRFNVFVGGYKLLIHCCCFSSSSSSSFVVDVTVLISGVQFHFTLYEVPFLTLPRIFPLCHIFTTLTSTVFSVTFFLRTRLNLFVRCYIKCISYLSQLLYRYIG